METKQKAWSTMVIVGLTMAALTILQLFFYTGNRRRAKTKEEIVRSQSKFWSRLCQFSKNKLGSCLYFIIPLGESQLQSLLTFPY
jgi:hypothetical protein